MMELVKRKTSNVREKLAYSLASLLVPSMYKTYLKQVALRKRVDAVPRPFTRFLVYATENQPVTGIEVGVGLGHNAKSLLTELPNIVALTCIDPCIGEVYRDGKTLVYTYFDKRKDSLIGQLRTIDKVKFMMVKSKFAWASFEKSKVDFVYVDGLHNYKAVLADLKGAWCVTKPYGYVGGHDIHQDSVKRAVCDFAWCIGQRPIVSIPDFWFRRLP